MQSSGCQLLELGGYTLYKGRILECECSLFISSCGRNFGGVGEALVQP